MEDAAFAKAMPSVLPFPKHGQIESLTGNG
jgi:hypothetical protein